MSKVKCQNLNCKNNYCAECSLWASELIIDEHGQCESYSAEDKLDSMDDLADDIDEKEE